MSAESQLILVTMSSETNDESEKQSSKLILVTVSETNDDSEIQQIETHNVTNECTDQGLR